MTEERTTTSAPPRTVGVVWALLVVNIMGFLPGQGAVIPIPKQVGQMVTMGALVLAFGMALLLNPRIEIRPSAYLLALSAIALIATVDCLGFESGLGSAFRTFRLTVFVLTLWLLSRWWRGQVDFALFHLKALCGVLLVVLAGAVLVPGRAFSEADGGRLIGVLWPIPAPQVGQYGAVVIGLAVLLWFARRLDGRSVVLVAVPALALLLLSHTRTALAGLIVGLAVATLSLAHGNARARGAAAGAVGLGVVGTVVAGQQVLTWLQRGQDADELTSFTGRQKVWDAILEGERPVRELLFGVGLTDKSFNGLPIDSTWLSVYHELGLIGVTVVVVMIVVLLAVAGLRPSSVQRACAVFLIVYCVVASFTEVGLGDASAYLLHLAVAASLLATAPRRSGGSGNGSFDGDEITAVSADDIRPGALGKRSAPAFERWSIRG